MRSFLTPFLVALVVLLATALAVLLVRHRGFLARFGGIVDAEKERERILAQVRTHEERQKQKLNEEAEQVRQDLAAQQRSAVEAIDKARREEEAFLARERSRVIGTLEVDRDAAEAALARARSEQVRLVEETGRQLERMRGDQEQALAERRAHLLSALEGERAALARDVEKSRGELATLAESLRQVRAEVQLLDEQAHLYSFGLYQPHYDFASSADYARQLDRIREEQKEMIKRGRAAICHTEWQVGGSKREGKKMTDRSLKLMLRAFNGECDAATAKVRYNNVHVMEARIEKAYEAINRLGEVQQCTLTADYLRLRLAELHLVHEYQEKVQEEKEEQRRIREQMREEEVAQRELERARQDAEKEESRYADALRKAQEEVANAEGAKQQRLLGQIKELERRLAEAQTARERAVAQAQLTRSGHVYVISNIGSFREEVYKIGMTRRLDPMERVRELGDASVPFPFDVHAVIYTEDAPGLENALHRVFQHRRVNRINERKEFFRVSIDEISQAVHANHGRIELTRIAEAEEFRKTRALEEERARTSPVATARWSGIGSPSLSA